MARAHDESSSLRLSRRESERLIVALLMSLLLHVTIASVYFAGRQLGWWQKWHLTAPPPKPLASHPLTPRSAPPPQAEPDMYVDVSHADADAPVQPKFYSSKNSKAANPDLANANVPKINGRQTDVPLTEDANRTKKAETPAKETTEKEAPKETARETPPAKPAQSLQPARPPVPTEAATEATPETPPTEGETELRKPPQNPPAAEPRPPPRPRTLKQALAQQNQIPGVAMQQAGGVARPAAWVALDAKATPFGEYDGALIEAIRQRWYDLLDSQRFAQDRTGKVTVQFKLKPDGTVSGVHMQENTVGDVLGYLCQESIEESAPFAKWPADMVRMVGANYREVSFTFYYY
jgi:outer membrane biosynthesis protein TonB